jgi:hypothetical protein
LWGLKCERERRASTIMLSQRQKIMKSNRHSIIIKIL